MIATLVMLLLALPRTITNWEDIKAGSYSSLWFIWPMIGFGVIVIALAVKKIGGPHGAELTEPVVEEPEEWLHSDRENR